MFAELSDKAKTLQARLAAFMDARVYPNEREILAGSQGRSGFQIRHDCHLDTDRQLA